MSTVIDGSASVTINSGAVLGITSGTLVTSTSGTSIDFTGIPSWVKRITVMFQNVSLSGTADFLIQIGPGSVTTTGYTSTGGSYNASNATSGTSSTSGYVMRVASAAATVSGQMVLTTLGSNIWASSHSVKISTANVSNGGGDIILSGTLDRVRITTTNGTDTFDSGFINILYE